VTPAVGNTSEVDIANRVAAISAGNSWDDALVIRISLSEWQTGEREFERCDITVATTNRLEGKLIASDGQVIQI
jgi:hypothetical protein